jgi:hypothetical protein
VIVNHSSAPFELSRGNIYRDVYAKRAASASSSNVVADLVTAVVGDDNLRFASTSERSEAMRAGIFLLRVPDGVALAPADSVANSFYLPDTLSADGQPFRSLSSERFSDPLLGFHARTDQIEQFLLEARFWRGVYPEPVLSTAAQLRLIAAIIVRDALDYAGIPPHLWFAATGGCSSDAGAYHLTFNHYRPAHRSIGLSSHKDDGFVTILRTTWPGLEVNVDNHWELVPGSADVLVVNFGLATELLTRAAAHPISAIMHRVVEQTNDRDSWALFSSSNCAPDGDAGIFAYNCATGLERLCGSRELIYENDHEIYEGTEKPSEG